MGNLHEKICVIAGGSGTVGEAIVLAFLNEGATVAVPSRSDAAIGRLRDYLGPNANERFVPFLGNIGDVEDAQRLRNEVTDRLGPIDAVVATLGGTWEERLNLVDVPMETWRRYWESNLTPHYVAAKTFLPGLANRKGSSYTLLGGLSAVMTIPNYSVVSINSAAQLMMARTLIEELKDSQVRINQLMCGFISTRARLADARPEWITAAEVGKFCAYLASAEASMISGAVIQLGNRPAAL